MKLYKAFATTDKEAFVKACYELTQKYKSSKFVIRTSINEQTNEYKIEVFKRTTSEELESKQITINRIVDDTLIDYERR